MSEGLRRKLLVALGFVFCLGALALAGVRTWNDLQTTTIEAVE